MWEGTEGASAEPLRQLCQELEDKSNGRITSEIAWGAVMGPPPEHYDLAASGVADVAFVMAAYTPGRFPMSEVADLPFSNFTQEQLAMAFAELYNRGYFDQDFADTHVLHFSAVGPYQLHMKEGKAIRSYNDIKNKKLRASGGVHTNIVQSIGGVPVGMPAPEVFTSLQKGVIDGAFVPWDFIASFRTETVVESVTETNFGGGMHLLAMNLDVYNNLPADLRTIVDEVSQKYNAISAAGHDELTLVAQQLLKDEGGEVYQLSDADMQQISEGLTPIWEEWIGGDATKAKMVADMGEILEGLGVTDPILGYTP